MKNKSIYHWLVVAACCGLVCGALGIALNCSGIFYTPVAESLGVGRGDISMYSTVCNLTGGLLSPIIVKLMMKIKLKVLMTVGVIFVCGGIAAMSMAMEVWMFYICAFFVGVGFSCCGTIPVTIILGNWFEEKHGFVMGIAFCFSGIGGAVFTPIFSSLISSIGWRSTYLIVSAIILVMTLPGILFIIRLTPSQKGLLPYGAKDIRHTSAEKNKPTITTKNLITTVFILMCSFTVLTSFVTGMGSHFPGYAAEADLSVSVGAFMLTAGMVGNIIFKLILGVMSDKIGAVKSCVLLLGISTAALAVLTFTSGENQIIALSLALLYGAVYAVAAVGVPLVVKAVYGIKNYPVVNSYVSIFAFAGGAVALTIIGYIYDIFGSYKIATASCGVLAVISAILLILTSALGKKKKIRE